MSVGRTRLGKPKPESMILLQVWHVPVHFTKICSGCVVHLHIMFTCQVAWCSLFRWLGPPSPGLEAGRGVFTSTHRPRGLTTVLVHNQSQEAWTWNKYLQVTSFTGDFFYRWLGRYQVQVLRGGTECLLDLRRWLNHFKSHRYNKDWLEFNAISRMSQSMIKSKKISSIPHYIRINWNTAWINSPNGDDLKYLSQEMTLSLNLSCGHVKAAVLLGRCLFWHLLWNPLFHKVGFGYISNSCQIAQLSTDFFFACRAIYKRSC